MGGVSKGNRDPKNDVRESEGIRGEVLKHRDYKLKNGREGDLNLNNP